MDVPKIMTLIEEWLLFKTWHLLEEIQQWILYLGKTIDNAGQVLKELLHDNNVDVAKFVSCKKRVSSFDIHSSEEQCGDQSFTITRRKKLR